MYRFSLAESADPRGYVVAGANAGADALSIQQTLDRSAPDYAGLNTIGRDLARQERVSDAKADLDKALAKMGIKEYDSARSLNEQRIKANNTQRFAGKLAAVGMLAHELNRKEFEPSPPKPLDFSKYEQAIRSTNDQVQELQDLIDNMKPPEKPPFLTEAGGEVTMNPSSPNSSTAARYALKKTIRRVEGTLGPDGYRTMFGGGLFDDTSKHPNTVVHSGQHSSAAAGAYQFMPATWEMVGKNINLPDFDVDSQERASDWLIGRRKVDPDVRITSLDQMRSVNDLLAPEWAGLPYQDKKSYHPGQGQYNHEQVYDFYRQYLLEGLRMGLQ